MMNCTCSASKLADMIMERFEELPKNKLGKYTSDENIKICLGVMAYVLAKHKNSFKWGNKVNCKAVASYIYCQWSDICPKYREKGLALTNLEKDISAGLKLIEEKSGTKIYV